MYNIYTLPNGEVRKGFALNFVLKPGKVTMLMLVAMHDEYRFKIIRGKSKYTGYWRNVCRGRRKRQGTCELRLCHRR